jgi:hypothetical protein
MNKEQLEKYILEVKNAYNKFDEFYEYLYKERDALNYLFHTYSLINDIGDHKAILLNEYYKNLGKLKELEISGAKNTKEIQHAN